MSYDIDLCDPVTGEVLESDGLHGIAGGTYVLGGTRDLSLNVTYNYAPHFIRTIGEGGIRAIYGMTGADSIPVLEAAIAKLGDEPGADYWDPTEGNAKRALRGLLHFAVLRPDGVWQGD